MAPPPTHRIRWTISLAHEGWLPSAAAHPRPVVGDVWVEIHSGSDGFVLQVSPADPATPDDVAFHHDDWFETLDEALEAAELDYGITRSDWSAA